MSRLIAGLMIALWALCPQTASAQSCTAGTFAGSYGTIDVLPGTAINTTATFSISCTGTVNSTVRLCIDIDAGGASPRTLTSGANSLSHELYSDASRTKVWGAWGFAGPAYSTGGFQLDLALGATGSATATATVYGRIAASQNTAIPGSYNWTSSSPNLQYGYSTGTACPTGGAIVAQGASSSMMATLNANATLAITNVNFGSKGLLTTATNANGTVTIKATNTTPYVISIGPGTGSGATAANRRMSSGIATITYSLYQDSGRTVVWGDTSGTNTVSKTGTGVNQATTVYGRVPIQLSPMPGSYSDTVVVTLTY